MFEIIAATASKDPSVHEKSKQPWVLVALSHAAMVIVYAAMVIVYAAMVIVYAAVVIVYSQLRPFLYQTWLHYISYQQ